MLFARMRHSASPPQFQFAPFHVHSRPPLFFSAPPRLRGDLPPFRSPDLPITRCPDLPIPYITSLHNSITSSHSGQSGQLCRQHTITSHPAGSCRCSLKLRLSNSNSTSTSSHFPGTTSRLASQSREAMSEAFFPLTKANKMRYNTKSNQHLAIGK